MSLYRNIDSEENMALIEEFRSAIKRNYTINNELYNEYNVKRGLRNANGTGVLVGLTRIGYVHAYIMDENEKVPVEGRLLYRGIDINDFVEGFQRDRRFGFEECCYLLLFGELPTREQLEAFTRLLSENRRLPDGFTRDLILKAPSKDIMIMLSRSMLAMYSYDQDPDDTSIGNVLRQCIGIVAYLPISGIRLPGACPLSLQSKFAYKQPSTWDEYG